MTIVIDNKIVEVGEYVRGAKVIKISYPTLKSKNQRLLLQCPCGEVITKYPNAIRQSKFRSVSCKKCRTIEFNKRIRPITIDGDRIEIGSNFRGSIVLDIFIAPMGNTKTMHIKLTCVDCGKEVIRVPSDLRRRVALKVTLCSTCVVVRRNVDSAIEDKRRASNSTYSRYRNSAKRRGISFNITKEEFDILIWNNCEYCGTEPDNIFNYHRKSKMCSVKYSGVDRSNNENGYEASNCVSCCRTCNVAKSNMTQDQWFSWINRLTEKWSKKK